MRRARVAPCSTSGSPSPQRPPGATLCRWSDFGSAASVLTLLCSLRFASGIWKEGEEGVLIQAKTLYGVFTAIIHGTLNSTLDLGLISEKRRGHFVYMPSLALRLGRLPWFARRASLLGARASALGRRPRPRWAGLFSARGLAAQSPGPPALLTSLLGRRACAGPACCARLWAARFLRACGLS